MIIYLYWAALFTNKFPITFYKQNIHWANCCKAKLQLWVWFEYATDDSVLAPLVVLKRRTYCCHSNYLANSNETSTSILMPFFQLKHLTWSYINYKTMDLMRHYKFCGKPCSNKCCTLRVKAYETIYMLHHSDYPYLCKVEPCSWQTLIVQV